MSDKTFLEARDLQRQCRQAARQLVIDLAAPLGTTRWRAVESLAEAIRSIAVELAEELENPHEDQD